MSSASHSPIATLLGWYFVPNFATSLLLRGFYSFLPSYRPRVPRNPTPDVAAQANARARKHATRAHVLVISTYLLYSLSNAYAGVLSQPNAYALLGLPTRTGEAGQGDEWDAGLKKQWRTLVRVAHPDKTGPAGEARFVAMRSAYETLSHAVKKDAYDRFGPDIAARCGTKCVNERDFMSAGLLSSAGFYIGFLVSLGLYGLFRKRESASYWRYLLLASLAAIEFHLVSRPSHALPPSLNGLTPYQTILLLHRLYIVAICALNQLGPLLFPLPTSTTLTAESLAPSLSFLRSKMEEGDVQAFSLLHAEIQPILRDPSNAMTTSDREAAIRHNALVGKKIKEGMVDLLAEGAVRQDSEGGEAWKAAVSRREEGTPKRVATPKRESLTPSVTPKREASMTPSRSPTERRKSQLPTPRATPEPEVEADWQDVEQPVEQVKREEVEEEVKKEVVDRLPSSSSRVAKAES